jgi:hypothetical protein
MSDDLKVPKRRAQVEVLLPGGAVRQVTIFLAEYASAHDGPERLSDLLNGSDDFVPALDLASDTMTFLGRQSIAAARVAPDWDEEDAPATSQQEVEITLTDGTELRGTMAFVLSEEHSRLLDYLNDLPPFVRLMEQGRVALVNKRHIARVAKVK